MLTLITTNLTRSKRSFFDGRYRKSITKSSCDAGTGDNDNRPDIGNPGPDDHGANLGIAEFDAGRRTTLSMHLRAKMAVQALRR